MKKGMIILTLALNALAIISQDLNPAKRYPAKYIGATRIDSLLFNAKAPVETGAFY
jgi:hypothetical protein